VQTAALLAMGTVQYDHTMTALPSVCPLDCPDTCSLTVTVDGGRITAVDGSRQNPYTDGFICAKVRRYPQRIYSPLRVLHPQRRIGAKGEGRFARISWDDALALIAERFRAIIAGDGAEAILPYHYGGSNGLFGEGAADARFFHRLGASELRKTLCAAPTGTVARAMYGVMGGVPPEDYDHARFVLLWGVNPSATNIHLVPHLRAAQRRGAFLAVIDPRRTPLARGADLHLAPRPGTDVPLALAMIAEIARRGATATAFLAAHANGTDALLQAAAEWPLDRAAAECGVAAADIAALVTAYLERSPAVVRCGWGIERNRNGGQAVRAILALPAIAGKFGVRGGGYTMSLGRTFPIDATALARPDLRRRPVRAINMVQLGRALTEPIDPPIRALFVYNANPVAMTPDQNRILAGLTREDLFTVVHEQVMTDTARFADVLLPAATVFEQHELHRAYGHYRLQYSEPVIAPLGEARTNPQLFAQLARVMGFEEPALQAEETELLADALGADRSRFGDVGLDELRVRRAVPLQFRGRHELIQFGTDFPSTPSGRIELTPDVCTGVSYQSPDGRFPLVLLSPATERTINSIFGELGQPAPRLALHPDDAGARQIGDGAPVRVFNELGEVHVRAQLTRNVRPGVVVLPKGLWCDRTLNGRTATALAPDTLTDIGAGACFNDARVDVAPLALD
jgi:anaerobic selenocysteine-containing dehydrogenase